MTLIVQIGYVLHINCNTCYLLARGRYLDAGTSALNELLPISGWGPTGRSLVNPPRPDQRRSRERDEPGEHKGDVVPATSDQDARDNGPNRLTSTLNRCSPARHSRAKALELSCNNCYIG